METRKQASWHQDQPEVYHFRTPKGIEVDAVEVVVCGMTATMAIKAGAWR